MHREQVLLEALGMQTWARQQHSWCPRVGEV